MKIFAYKLIVSTPKRMQSLTQKSSSVFEKSRKQIVSHGHSFVTDPYLDERVTVDSKKAPTFLSACLMKLIHSLQN